MCEMNSMEFIDALKNDWDNGLHIEGTAEHYETQEKEFIFLKTNKKRKELNKWKKKHGYQYLYRVNFYNMTDNNTYW